VCRPHFASSPYPSKALSEFEAAVAAETLLRETKDVISAVWAIVPNGFIAARFINMCLQLGHDSNKVWELSTQYMRNYVDSVREPAGGLLHGQGRVQSNVARLLRLTAAPGSLGHTIA